MSHYSSIVPGPWDNERVPLPDDPGRAIVRTTSRLIRVVLDSTHGDYAGVVGGLDVVSVQDAGYSSSVKLVTARMPPDREGVLVPIQRPNKLGIGVYMDEYIDDEDFLLRGFALLGLDSRNVRYVGLPQNSDGTGIQNGDGLGRTYKDRFRGAQDPLIGPTNHTAQTATTYYICDGAHVRHSDFGSGGNPLFGNGGADQGSIAVADASGLGHSQRIEIRGDYPDRPGMFWASHTYWEKAQILDNLVLPWELYKPGVYVNGVVQSGNASVGRVLGLSFEYDADVEDVGVSATELLRRHIFARKDVLSDLDGDGGRGRYHAQHNFGGNSENWTGVVFNDGAGNWADLTAAANDATSGDFTVFPAGAVDGAYVALVSDVPFSVAWINLAQAAAGATFQFLYSAGGLNFNSFANSIDQTNGLTVTSPVQFAFNPKSDWVQDTFASGQPFQVTGYALIIRKVSGSLAASVLGDQFQRRRRGAFIHRWNDAAPTRGICTSTTFNGGFRYRTENKGNLTYVNFRMGPGTFANSIQMWGNLTDWVRHEGCQLISFADHQFTSGTSPLAFVAGSTGRRWWSIEDHLVQSGGHPIFTDPECGLVAYHGDDPGYYADRARWTDLCFIAEGLYKNGGGPKWYFSGFVMRKQGVVIQGMNDPLLDLFQDPGDNHFLAGRNNQDWDGDVLERWAAEEILSCEIYAAGTGGINIPVTGSGSNQRNIRFRHGYIYKWNARTDPQQPGRCFGFVGDSDRGAYSNGTGLMDGNEVEFFYFKDMDYTPDTSRGHALTLSQHISPRVRKITADNCNWMYVAQKDQEQCLHTFVLDASLGVYTDVSLSLIPSGAGGITMFPDPPAPGDMFIGALPAFMAQFPHRMRWVLGTPAAMGTAVLSLVYWRNDNTWALAANPTSTDLTADNTCRFDAPSDMGEININGTLYHAYGFRFESGAFTTIPILNQITGRLVGGAVDIEGWVCKHPRVGVGGVTAGSLATNGTVVKATKGKIIYGPGQDASTPLFAYGTALFPNQTPAQWQANVKGGLQTDALEPSVFDPDLVTV